VTTILKALTSSFDAVRAAPRAACIGSSLFFSASAVVAAWLSETRRRGAAAGNEEEEDGLPALSAALRDRRLAGLLLSVGALEIAVSWIEAITPLYANTAGALSPTGVGLLFAYAGVLGVIFQLPVARATQGLSGFAAVLWGGAIQAVAFAVLLPSPRPPLLIAAITLLAFARMPSGPLSQVIVSELAPNNAQATYQAAFSVVSDLRDAAGPAIGTHLYATASVLPWGVGIVASLVASIALAATARSHEMRQRKQ
jgi:DHA1 family tetracycline resistance protein-like MFS transporter